MKKIFTLLMGAVIALSASAAPQIAKRGEAKTISNEISLPTHFFGQFDRQGRSARRVLAAGTPVSGIASAEVAFYKQVWYFDCYDANDKLVAEFGFYNGKEDQIAGQYAADGKSGVAMLIAAPGDTVNLSGAFNIAYVSEGTEYPIYRLTASDMKDTLNREFDFDFQAEIYAYNAQNMQYCQMASYYCEQDPQSEYCDYADYYCSMVDIELQDAPVVPTGDTIRHTFDAPADFADYTEGDARGDKWFQAISMDEEYRFSVCINTDHLIGSFGNEDFDADYTVLYNMSDTSKINLDTLIGAQVSESNDTVFIVTTVRGRDGVVYIFTQKVYDPAIVDEKSIELSGEMDDTYFASYGTVDFKASDDANEFVISLYVNDGFVGTYTAEDLDSYYCEYNVDGQALNVHAVANIIVAAEEGGYVLTADILTKEGILYHLTIHGSYSQGIEDVAAEGKAVKVLRDGQLIIIKNGVKFNAQGAIIK